jgi:hypothetical protein
MPWITRGDALMNRWTSDELSKIGTAEELRIRSLRRDGTLRSPTTIWVVRHGEDLYVRPVNGRTSGWFRGTQVRQEGHIQCGGVDKDVTFVSVDAADEVNAAIDAAYSAKYRRYPASYIDAVLTPEAKSATIKLQPRS